MRFLRKIPTFLRKPPTLYGEIHTLRACCIAYITLGFMSFVLYDCQGRKIDHKNEASKECVNEENRRRTEETRQ